MNPVFGILVVLGFIIVGIKLVPFFGKRVLKVIDKLQKEWNGEDDEEKEDEER